MLITKNDAIAISTDIENAINAILEKHNLKVNKIRSKYGDEYQFSISASPIKLNDKGVSVTSPEAQEFIMFGKHYGFDNPEATLGATFISNGKTLKFTGLSTRKSKFPVHAIDTKTQKSFGYPMTVLARLEGFNADLVPNYLRSELGLPEVKVGA